MKSRNPAYWLCQIVGWGTYSTIGLSFAANDVGAARMPRIISLYAIFFAFAILLTHLLRREIKRRQWLNLPMRKALPRLAASAILVGLIASAEVIGLDYATGGGGEWSRVAVLSIIMSLTTASLIWMVLYVAITATRRALEMRLRLREAELRALEAQVNPHFLFNSLNTIRGMIVEDASVAQDMVTRLANILRYSLQRERTYTVSLEREMEVVADYLAIESIRFDHRLRVRIEIQPAAAAAQVPSMLVQTLVENALKHGIGTTPEGGEVLIRAAIQDGALTLEIVNPGCLEAPREDATQIGLANARLRLRLLYGDKASLKLENRGGSVAALVTIPA
ncbi:MAG TPA: histidine kinase [Bryobacteraceae bacterium]|nr:histidine kinase [Bryobacteraceae bacterium]